MTGARPALIQSVAILKLNWDLYRRDSYKCSCQWWPNVYAFRPTR